MADLQKAPLLSIREKFGYAVGDFACDLFFMLFIYYGLYFYTDVFGIPAAAAGTMFLITKFWDTMVDPIMGIIADRTNTRFGKFRPYLIWLAIPFGVIGIFAFSSPDFDTTGKIIYSYVTYTLMMMIYSAINIPYSALMGGDDAQFPGSHEPLVVPVCPGLLRRHCGHRRHPTPRRLLRRRLRQDRKSVV